MTKDAVLAILRKENIYISGEKISSLLGISRAAVNTAVKSLRAEGYEILSSTNKGYYLKSVADKITSREMSAYLSKQRMSSVLCLDSLDSTNNHLRNLAFTGAPDGQVVIANEQTDGRGRYGRIFVSPKDKGIYLSMLFRPSPSPVDTAEITAWTAVAVSNAIESICGVRPGIKWVNDLTMNQKKICGILTEISIESESRHIQYLIIGIGLNVNEIESDFPAEIRHIASSLLLETGQMYLRAQLAAEIIKELDYMRSVWPQKKQEFLNAYKTNNITTGKRITVFENNVEKDAFAESINEDFSLNICYADGRKTKLSSGEVSIRGIIQ